MDWVYIDDVNDGLLLLAASPAVWGYTIDLGSGTLVTVRDVVLPSGRHYRHGRSASRSARCPTVRSSMSVGLTRQHMGSHRGGSRRDSLREGLECTEAWYAEHP
jgi:nucleoside-diphosphate-sugar epimerase